MKYPFRFFIVINLLIISSGCPAPDPVNYTISGRVFNGCTGVGITGAHVMIGDRIVTTETNGNYSLSMGNSGVFTGTFGAWYNQDYSFWLLYDVSLDLKNQSVYDIKLDPNDISSYTRVTISGAIPQADSTNGGILNLEVYNQMGGRSSAQTTIAADATDYSLEVIGGEMNSLIIVKYQQNASLSQSTSLRYYTNQDLRNNLTLDITSGGTTTITVNGQIGAGFLAHLAPPVYRVYEAYVPMTGLGADSMDIQVFNPDNFPQVWNTISSQLIGNDAFQRYNISGVIPFSSQVNLPAPVDPANDPAESVDASTASYNSTDRTVAFTGVTGTNFYMLSLTSDSSNFGNIMIIGDSFILPESFMTDVIEPDSGWDLRITAAWTSDRSLFVKNLGNRYDNIEPVQAISVMNMANTDYRADFIP